MLEPNVIPTEEPILRVGIFLPIDKCQRIALVIPQSPVYELIPESGPRQILKGGEQVEFILFENQIGIQINGLTPNAQLSWKIIPRGGEIQIANKAGIKVKNVVAGRGFHWEKYIDVYLPGSIEISRMNDNLIMINVLPLEQYLMCVATSEMGAACPLSVIKSQTIIARSWLLANVEMKHRNLGMDVCNDDCCQRYQGTTFLSEHSIKGALETTGQVLIYGEKICDTRYHKNCGGVTESFENVWNGSAVPYLDSVIDIPPDCPHSALPLDTEAKVRNWIENPPLAFCCPSIVPEKELKKYLGNVDKEGHYFRWHFRMTQREITALFNLKLNLDAAAIKSIEPLKRGKSGRLTSLAINYRDKANVDKQIVINDQYAIREAFHELFLYSSAFVVDVEEGSENIPAAFVLKGAGWGHGVGYCQIGALGMALKGYSTLEILEHYYPGVKLHQAY